MRFTLTCDDRGDYATSSGHKTTIEFETDVWGEALENFQYFLGGCGFIIDQTKVNFKELCEEKHHEDTKLPF